MSRSFGSHRSVEASGLHPGLQRRALVAITAVVCLLSAPAKGGLVSDTWGTRADHLLLFSDNILPTAVTSATGNGSYGSVPFGLYDGTLGTNSDGGPPSSWYMDTSTDTAVTFFLNRTYDIGTISVITNAFEARRMPNWFTVATSTNGGSTFGAASEFGGSELPNASQYNSATDNGTTTGGRLITVTGGLGVNAIQFHLKNSGVFGGSNGVFGEIVVTAVPEIDPATGGSALSLVAGMLAMLERRARRVLGRRVVV